MRCLPLSSFRSMRVFPEHEWEAASAARFCADGANVLLFAYRGDLLCGLLVAYRLRCLDGRRAQLFIDEVDVHEDSWRRGIGRAMVLRPSASRGKWALARHGCKPMPRTCPPSVCIAQSAASRRTPMRRLCRSPSPSRGDDNASPTTRYRCRGSETHRRSRNDNSTALIASCTQAPSVKSPWVGTSSMISSRNDAIRFA